MTNGEALQLVALLRQLAKEGRDAVEVLQANHDLSNDELNEAVAQLEELY